MVLGGSWYIYIRLEPETFVYKWLFQLDDSKPLHKKWWFHHLHPFKTGCLGFQVYIIMPWFPQAMSDQHLRDLLTSARPTWTCKAPEIRKINGEKRVVMLIGEVKDDDYPIIYRVSAPSQVVVWDFSHQPYHPIFGGSNNANVW